MGEYFAEFAKYRKAASESDDWDKGFNKFYGERTRAFIEDYGTDFTYRKNNRIVEFLHKDYNNDFEGRSGGLEQEIERKQDLNKIENIEKKVKEMLEILKN